MFEAEGLLNSFSKSGSVAILRKNRSASFFYDFALLPLLFLPTDVRFLLFSPLLLLLVVLDFFNPVAEVCLA